RVVIELATQLEAGEEALLRSDVSWARVSGDATRAQLTALSLGGTTNELDVEQGRDGGVFASATSAFASVRQIEANDAYTKGDVARGDALLDENLKELKAAAPAAPAPIAVQLEAQEEAYRDLQRARLSPRPAAANAATKTLQAHDIDNLSRA